MDKRKKKKTVRNGKERMKKKPESETWRKIASMEFNLIWVFFWGKTEIRRRWLCWSQRARAVRVDCGGNTEIKWSESERRRWEETDFATEDVHPLNLKYN